MSQLSVVLLSLEKGADGNNQQTFSIRKPSSKELLFTVTACTQRPINHLQPVQI